MAEANKVRAIIPIRFVNFDSSNFDQVGSLAILLHTVTIEGESGKLPDSVTVDLGIGGREGQIAFQSGQLTVEDLLPPGRGAKIVTNKNLPVLNFYRFEQQEQKREGNDPNHPMEGGLTSSAAYAALSMLARKGKPKEEIYKKPDTKEGQSKNLNNNTKTNGTKGVEEKKPDTKTEAKSSPPNSLNLEQKTREEAYFISQDPTRATGNPQEDWAKAEKLIKERVLPPIATDPRDVRPIENPSIPENESVRVELKEDPMSLGAYETRALNPQASNKEPQSDAEKEDNLRRRGILDQRRSSQGKASGPSRAVRPNPLKGLKNLKRLRTSVSAYSMAPILLIIFLFVGGAIMLFGGFGGGGVPGANAGESGGGTSGPPPISGGGGTAISLDELKQLIIVDGGTQADADRVYKIFQIPMSSPKYKQLLTAAGPVHITFDDKPCGGRVETSNTIILHSFSSCSDPYARWILVHESGHIVAARNSSLYDSYSPGNLELKDGTACYTFIANGSSSLGGWFIKTYPLQDTGHSGKAESFGENFALYAFYADSSYHPAYGKPSLPNFPTTCPATYSWIQDNIYGPVDFQGDGVIPSSSQITTSGNSTVSSDPTCGGKYTSANRYGTTSEQNPGKNYGDVTCNFSKDSLYSSLKSLDPKNADRWYYKIIPCESSYEPNHYASNSQSGKGAWGLFSMNPKGRGNNQYDAGDVNWTEQITNAINYNNGRGQDFLYWECR